VNFIDHSKLVVTPISNSQRSEVPHVRVLYVTNNGTKRSFVIDPAATLPTEVLIKIKGEEGSAYEVSVVQGRGREDGGTSRNLSPEVVKRLLFLLQCIPKLLKPTSPTREILTPTTPLTTSTTTPMMIATGAN
jgi:hypothetical protein